MRPRVTDHVVDLLQNRTLDPKMDMTQEESVVADWLRGDEMRLNTLLKMLAARIEGRGLLPAPSTPNDVAMMYGRDREAREIMNTLVELFAAPVTLGSDEEDNG